MDQGLPLVQRPTFWLSFVYLSVALVVLYQLVSTIYHRYRKLSYHFGFLILCFFLNIIRFISFILFYEIGSKSTFMHSLLFRVPVNIQFATMSLLVIFFVNVVYQSLWKKIRIKAWFAYMLCNAAFLIFLIISLVIKNSNTRLKVISGITSSIMLLLLITIGIFGFKVRNLILKSRNPDPKLWGITSVKITLCTLLIIIIYFTRALYVILSQIRPNFALYFGSTRVSQIPQEILASGLYAIWEIIPTLLILILFWRSSPTKISTNSKSLIYQKFLSKEDNTLPEDYIPSDIAHFPLLGKSPLNVQSKGDGY